MNPTCDVLEQRMAALDGGVAGLVAVMIVAMLMKKYLVFFYIDLYIKGLKYLSPFILFL